MTIFSKKVISKWAVPYQKDKFWRDPLKIDLFGTKHLHVIYECMSFFMGHFGPIWGLFCVILAQNLKLSQASHVKTQKDRKRSRIPMEIVSEVTFKTFRFMLGPFGDILSHFWSFWSQDWNCQRLVMWSLKTTPRGAELQWRWLLTVIRNLGPEGS